MSKCWLEREGPVEPKKSPSISIIVRHESTHLTWNSHDLNFFTTAPLLSGVCLVFFDQADNLELEIRSRTDTRLNKTFEGKVSDPVYLSLWFSDFSGPEMLPHAFAVLQQFPFSAQRPGISYFAVHPVSWGEATVLERRFPGGIDPGQATLIVAELIHDDYAYVFEAHWDLWAPDASSGNWVLEAAPVRFIVQGEQFDEGAYQQTGHIQVDFGLDSYFLQPETPLSEQTRSKIRENVAKLVEFSVKVDKNSGTSSRVLWSESEESLAQKLIARLQKVQ
jgi:hypothetical protein